MTMKALTLMGVAAVLCLLFALIAIVPYFKIFPRLGYSKWSALLMLVPLANFIFLYIVAFSTTLPPIGEPTNPS
jgi:hypothetical protein